MQISFPSVKCDKTCETLKKNSNKDDIIFLLFQETFQNCVQKQEVQGWIINIYLRQ